MIKKERKKENNNKKKTFFLHSNIKGKLNEISGEDVIIKSALEWALVCIFKYSLKDVNILYHFDIDGKHSSLKGTFPHTNTHMSYNSRNKQTHTHKI